MRSVCPCYIWWKLYLEGKARQKTVLWCVITKAYRSSNKVSALCITLSQTQNHFPIFLQSQHLLVYAMFFINYFHWYKNRLHHDIFILIGLIYLVLHFPFVIANATDPFTSLMVSLLPCSYIDIYQKIWEKGIMSTLLLPSYPLDPTSIFM